MRHLIVVEIRQGDESRATYAPNDYDFTDLAHQVVTLNREEATTLCLLEQFDCEVKQII
jgi:hypothetical protein